MKITSAFLYSALLLLASETIMASPSPQNRGGIYGGVEQRSPQRPRPTPRRTPTPTPRRSTTSTSRRTTTSAPGRASTSAPSASPSASPTSAPAGGNNGGNGGNNGGNGGNNGGGNGANQELILLQDNVQDGSQNNGQQNGAAPGQAPSLTNNANFINFCSGKKLLNGIQGRQPGSGPFCNGIPMGDIPDRTKMVSSLITFPQFGQDIELNQQFEITVKMLGLNAGVFTNPDLTYYAAPQQLDGSGNIIGHTHVTIQFLGASLNDINTQTVPNPDNFKFFKGINDAGDGNGNLKATVNNGIDTAGVYRVCTMASAGNHQPVLMPVAQRGAQDDCVRFTVGLGNNRNGGGNNGGN